ncbi:hypothetical protein FOCC_FOCC001697 [Frankliniella occidentalis]|nr:hypothetical protein FOCC_FOCC001697 [Frankliniella occidentalis]
MFLLIVESNDKSIKDMEVIKDARQQETAEEQMHQVPINYNYLYKTDILKKSAEFCSLINSDTIEEIWHLPHNLCRICAQNDENAIQLFSDESNSCKILDMIKEHLSIAVTPKDILPLYICHRCLNSLQATDRLIKTCSMTDENFHWILDHICRLSFPDEANDKFDVNKKEGTSKHSMSLTDKQLNKFGDNFPCAAGEKIKSNCVTVVKLTKENTSIFQDVLKSMSAHPIYKRKEEKGSEIVCAMPESPAAHSTCSSSENSIFEEIEDTEIIQQNIEEQINQTGNRNDCKFSSSILLTIGAKEPSQGGRKRKGNTVEENTQQVENQIKGESLLLTGPKEPAQRRKLRKRPIEEQVQQVECQNEAESITALITGPKKTTKVKEKRKKQPNAKQVNHAEDQVDGESSLTVTDSKEPTECKIKRKRKPRAKLKKKLKCPDCDYSTHVKEDFAEHKVTHLKCRFCDKSLKSKWHLIEHERIHTREKPVVCDHCGLGFRTKQQMMSHAQRHNAEKPYVCHECGKRFSVKSTYAAHLLRHNPDSPHLCDICGKSFKLQDGLRIHRLNHRTFTCTSNDKSIKDMEVIKDARQQETAEEQMHQVPINYNYLYKTDILKKSAEFCSLINSDTIEEIWHLPHNLCRICAQNDENAIQLFSDESNSCKILDMIKEHLSIAVTPKDILPLYICHRCLNSLQATDRLIKTCSMTDENFHWILDHICRLSFPDEANDKFDVNKKEGTSKHSMSLTDKQLNKFGDNFPCAAGEKIKSNCVTVVKLTKENTSIFQDVLKSMSAHPIYKRKEKKGSEIVCAMPESPAAHSTCSSSENSIFEEIEDTEIIQQNIEEQINQTGNRNDCKFSSSILLTIGAKEPSQGGRKRKGNTVEENTQQVENQIKGESLLLTGPKEPAQRRKLRKRPIEEQVQQVECQNEAESITALITGPKKTTKVKEKRKKQPNAKQVNHAEDQVDGESSLTVTDSKEPTECKIKRKRKPRAKIEKELKCPDCDYSTHVKEDFAEHKVTHLKCRFCDKSLKSKWHLIEHERIHTREKPVVCDHCGLGFRTKQQMMSHAQRHNAEKPYVCHECGKRFSVKSTYAAHLLRHNPDSPHLCDICGKSFKLQDGLRIHRLNHRTFTCTVCDKTFNYRCGVCHRSFNRMTTLQVHRQRHAEDLLLGLLFYRCAICHESFDTGGQLSRHIQNHKEGDQNNSKEYKCALCNKCFTNEQQLSNHTLQHKETQPLSCRICNKFFSNRTELDSHASDHFEDKPYACNICGDRFEDPSNLNSHKSVHLSTNCFTCEICAKSFKALDRLNQHKMVHSEVGTFTCLVCCVSFNERDALKKHERSHFVERPYTCSVCSRSFKVKSDCTTHLRRYHLLAGVEGTVLESVYSCLKCPKKFALRVDLINHTESLHSDQETNTLLLSEENPQSFENSTVQPIL